MCFTYFTPDSPYYLRPLFPEVEDIEEAPPIDETISAPLPEPQPTPPAKSIKKKKKIDPLGDDIDRVRAKSLLPLVKRNSSKYNDRFYEKRAANWQKKWEERKLQAIDKDEQRRIDFRNKLEHYGITFPATPQTH